jgi:hypothetical protein
MAKKKKQRKKLKKPKQKGHQGNIMTKAKVHNNEDLKRYDRKKTKKEEREAG